MTRVKYADEQSLSIGIISMYCVLFLFVACYLFLRWLSGPQLNLPKGPTGLPILGYLPFMGKEPHKTFHKLKDKYGNVFSLRLGQANVIILADYPAVREALSKSTTTYRPPGIFDILPDGFGLGGNNGALWAEGRKFAMKTMKDVGLGKTKWVRLIEEELDEFLDNISQSNGQPIDIGKLLEPSIANSIISLIFGRRFSELVLGSLLPKAKSVSQFFSPSGLWCYFPSLCSVLNRVKLSPYYEMYRNMVAFNKFVRNEIQNHKESQSDVTGTDFVSTYLEFLQDATRNGKETLLNESTMAGDVQILFIGGSDTIRSGINWLFLVIAAFPEVQRKVRNELESVSEKHKFASWDDRAKFPYTTAVIMEALRWKTQAPLTIPRMASEDIKIFDYDVPKGTLIITNIWGLHNDPRYWKDPEKFIPERFFKKGEKGVNLKPDSFLPFSFGKRKCPGELVAMMETFLYFTAVMLKYEIRVPNGGKLNLDGILGLTYIPSPQSLCFIPREEISAN